MFNNLDENIDNKKQSKTQSKIDRKLAQLSQQYEEQTKINQLQDKNKSLNIQEQTSRNKQQEKQRIQLQEECNSLNSQYDQIQLIMSFVEKYNALFVSTSYEKQIGDKTIQIVDVKLKTYNEQEDQLFATHQIIHNIFRRGLCLCYENGKYRVLRKGLKKFFDLQNFIIFSTPECFKIKQSLIKTTLHDYAFLNIPKDQKIQITIMEKINGENAQISYDIELNRWVIGSKNVTILCDTNVDESDDGERNRFRYAIQIAKQWFKFLSQSKEQDQIKELLSFYTLIGEYCGNEEYQHLVRYEKEELIFYSLVPKNKNDACLHPVSTLELLNKVQLKCAKSETINLESFDHVQKVLNDATKQIVKSSVQEKGEGSVVYISGFSESQPTYSLLKIKTLDYRLKRKIREKLKGFIKKNQNLESILEKYLQEAQSLVQQVNLGLDEPIVVDLQLDLARQCFQSINLEKCEKDYAFQQFCYNFINNQFVTFLELLEKQVQLEHIYKQS